MNPGIHLFHKPVGPTSFSLVQACMKSMPVQPGRRPARICHGGTLDPFASGLLLILVEPATKLFDYLHSVPKVYEATVHWGVETDNGDPNGAVTFTGDSSGISAEQLDECLKTFVGWQEQIPHATSAKRIDGERAYLKAHRGEAVVMPPSRVYLHEASWLSHDLPRRSRLRMTVRGGYYVRALARDLGRRLGCGAHLSQLHRAAIGPWSDPGGEQSVEVRGRGVLPWLASRELTGQEVGYLRKDQMINIGSVAPPDWQLPAAFPQAEPVVRAFHGEKLCFLLSRQEGSFKAIAALKSGL